MSEIILPPAPALTPTKLQLGLNSCSNSEYHSDFSYLSSSVIKTLCKSLDKYREEYLEGKKAPRSERTLDTFALGSYVHSRILEPHITDSEYAVYPGDRRQGADFEAFKALNSHKTILSWKQVAKCDEMIKAYNKLALAPKMINGGFSEQTICGILQDVPVKVRFDYINPDLGYIVDVKTTGYGSDIDSFKSTITDFNYELSAALYTKVAEEYYGRSFKFYFLVLSKRDFTCDLYCTSDLTQQKGLRQVSEGLSKFKRAVASGIWTETSGINARVISTEYEVLSV